MHRKAVLGASLCLTFAAIGVRCYSYLAALSSSKITDNYAECSVYRPTPCLEISSEKAEMIFEETVHYDTGGKLSQLEWLSARTPWGHGGYVRIGDDDRAYGITMIHQLHCAEMLALALSNPTAPNASPPHIGHCLQYLKQVFLCNADTLLEPFDFATRNFTAQPTGVCRACRNWAAVYAAADENYALGSGTAG